MRAQFQDSDLLQYVFVAVASARNSCGLLCDHLGRWLASKVVFVPDKQLPSMQDRYPLWTALGAEPEDAEALAFQLRLPWQGGRLEIAASCADMESLIEKLSGALLAWRELKQFTASRWATIGVSCRNIAAAILTGFSDLVLATRNAPRANDYHISGYAKLAANVKQFVCIAAFALYVCDGFLLELMADNGVALKFEEL